MATPRKSERPMMSARFVRENGRTKPGKTPGWIGEYPDQIMGDNPNSRGRRSRPVGGWDMRQGWPDRESLSAEKYTVSAGEPLNVRGTVYGLRAEVTGAMGSRSRGIRDAWHAHGSR